MELDEFVHKAKQIVIEKRITNRNVKYEWLKLKFELGHHESYLKELEEMPKPYLPFKYWRKEQIEHHKKQILKY